jgi:hypothetical protein
LCSNSSGHPQCVMTYCHDLPSCCMTFSLQMERSLLRHGSANYSGPFYEYINLNLQPSVIFDTYCISEYGVRSVRETCIYCHTKGEKPKLKLTRSKLKTGERNKNRSSPTTFTTNSDELVPVHTHHYETDFKHQRWTLVTYEW